MSHRKTISYRKIIFKRIERKRVTSAKRLMNCWFAPTDHISANFEKLEKMPSCINCVSGHNSSVDRRIRTPPLVRLIEDPGDQFIKVHQKLLVNMQSHFAYPYICLEIAWCISVSTNTIQNRFCSIYPPSSTQKYWN